MFRTIITSILLLCCIASKAQEINFIDVDELLKRKDQSGFAKATAALHQKNMLTHLYLIDSCFSRKLFAKSIQEGNYTDFEIKLLLRLSQVVKEEQLQQRLGETLIDYRHSFQKTSAYREYPNTDIFRALCYQKSAASIPVIDAEYREWQQLNRYLIGNASRNQKIIRHTLEQLRTTKAILLNKNVSDPLLKELLLEKSSEQRILERPGKWDTLSLLYSYKQVQQIKFKEEPSLHQLLDYGNFLGVGSHIDLCFKGQRAIISFDNPPWESTFQLELLNDHQIAIRFLTGGIE